MIDRAGLAFYVYFCTNHHYHRFKGIPEHLRLCEFCDLKVVVDEFDFVFYHPLHYDLRNSLFELIQLKKNPDIFWKYEGEILC